MEDHFQYIYKNRAKDYHKMIEAEDVDGNLYSTLKKITSFKNKHVLDIGTGTGRIPLLLSPMDPIIIGMDISLHMLLENKRQIAARGINYGLTQGTMNELPFPSDSFDIIISGWAIGHLTSWFQNNWQEEIDQILQEMLRVLISGGSLIIIETLSTGSTIPVPPTKDLAEYYLRLENEWGFKKHVIQTDYQFPNNREAINSMKFFFGEDLARSLEATQLSRVPEWTGLWNL